MHQVDRLDELVVAADRQRLRVGQRLLELAGQFVHAHDGFSRLGGGGAPIVGAIAGNVKAPGQAPVPCTCVREPHERRLPGR